MPGAEPLAPAVHEVRERDRPLEGLEAAIGRSDDRDQVPDALVSVIAKALEKRREMRYQTAADVEASDLRLIADVVAAVDLPVAVKLGPNYPAMANFARPNAGIEEIAGVDGVSANLAQRIYASLHGLEAPAVPTQESP